MSIGTSDERLVSGEAVELDVRIARLGSRALALMIDMVGQVVLLVVLFVLATLGLLAVASVDGFDEGLGQGTFTIVLALVVIGYPLFWETVFNGRTPGKAAMGLRVVRDDGGPVRFRHVLTRVIVGVTLEWPGLILPLLTWLASLGTMLANPRGKRLGDLAAGTIVIHDRTPASWGWIPAMPPPLAGWAALLDLTGLDDELALAVRHYLARNREITEPTRTALGSALAQEVARCTTPPPPPQIPGWAYLAAVLAERHRRAARQLVKARTASAGVWPDLHDAGRPAPLLRPAAPATRPWP